MLSTYNLNINSDFQKLISNFKKDWDNPEKKVFYFKSGVKINNIRDYYYNLFKNVGNFHKLAEDARINNREKQKNQEIWMEVRFDPTIENAYRHSSNAQPLHTDGSYNPDYPTATLMCCENNNAEKGETTFVDAKIIAEILKNSNLNLYQNILDHVLIHERSGDKKESPILIKAKNGIWNVNWNYYCVSKNINKKEENIKDNFQKFLLESDQVKKNLIEIKMNKGDALIWKDREVLHGRNSFVAKKNSARFIWKCAVNF